MHVSGRFALIIMHNVYDRYKLAGNLPVDGNLALENYVWLGNVR
jgi:hypothetical protein